MSLEGWVEGAKGIQEGEKTRATVQRLGLSITTWSIYRDVRTGPGPGGQKLGKREGIGEG